VLQPTVALSTMEDEYMAAAAAGLVVGDIVGRLWGGWQVNEDSM
jgi:hypothetical protein